MSNADTPLIDSAFFLPAGRFFPASVPVALTYDDVSLGTLHSEILPRDTDLATSLSDSVNLQIPIISSDMDTVTEARMAIAMALNGGLGLIHANMTAREQIKQVARVKRHVHGLIQDPITVLPTHAIGDVLAMVEEKSYAFRTFPVVDDDGKLVGLLGGNLVKERYRAKIVSEVMTKRDQLRTVDEKNVGKDPIKTADRFFNENVGIHKMLVVSADGHLRGLVTSTDVEHIVGEARSARKPARDASFRLLAGVAIAPVRTPDGALDRERILEHIANLVEEEVDAVAVSTAHGHTEGVGEMVRMIRDAHPGLTIIAGNVTSAAGVEFLADAGASAIKIGQGPGSICTTRVVAGVGVPQLTALYVAGLGAAKKGVRIIADGGIVKSGDIVKALTLANAVICGGLFAGTSEAPGEIVEIGGKRYKQYRGMGSLAAMNAGSASRYGHDKKDTTRKFTPEGIEALKEESGSVDNVIAELIGGVQSGMGYLGAANLAELRSRARYVRVSPAGQKEASPHDVIEIKAQKSGS